MAQSTQVYGDRGAESRTEVQLYVPSSKIKGEVDRIGANPFGQQWFMVYYVLAKHKLLHLWVTTEEELKTCKVEVKKGQALDSNMDISGKCYESGEEIENFSATFRCPAIQPTKVDELTTDKKGILPLVLYKNFNHLLANGKSKPLDATLTQLNDYFGKNGKKFIFEDQVTFADCMLMPRLHHVRVAAKELMGYEIPSHLTHLWRYLRDTYHEEAFKLSCPSDQDIIVHYQEKVGCGYKGHATIQATTFSWEVPECIHDNEVDGATNGGGHKDDETGE